MILAGFDFEEQKHTLIVIVISPHNLARMKEADPITLESPKHGGIFQPKYPANLSLVIAYEEDEETLQAMAAGNPAAFLRYLERGRKWIPGEDGKENTIPIAGKSAEPRH